MKRKLPKNFADQILDMVNNQDQLAEVFFASIKAGDYDQVVQIMEFKPLVLLEVDDMMRNALHLCA